MYDLYSNGLTLQSTLHKITFGMMMSSLTSEI